MIWTENLKLLTVHFCLFYSLLINTFFKAKSTKKTTHFQLNLNELSYIKLLLVFIEFSKTLDK